MAIDKAKGIIAKPMPKDWHDRHAANKIEDDDMRMFYTSIVASKKPYFMRYIYPRLMSDYKKYVSNTNKNALREFQLTVDEMESMPTKELTDRQCEFLHYYRQRLPVGAGDCVMNRICRRVEETFDGYIKKHSTADKFDYSIMRGEGSYTHSQFYSIKKLYDDYASRIENYAIFASRERVDEFESYAELSTMESEFRRQCETVCPNVSSLCNIVLDLCYRRSSTKKFAWSMCGDEIINNLLRANNNIICYPTMDKFGEVEYCGNRFTVEYKEIEGDLDDSIE